MFRRRAVLLRPSEALIWSPAALLKPSKVLIWSPAALLKSSKVRIWFPAALLRSSMVLLFRSATALRPPALTIRVPPPTQLGQQRLLRLECQRGLHLVER